MPWEISFSAAAARHMINSKSMPHLPGFSDFMKHVSVKGAAYFQLDHFYVTLTFDVAKSDGEKSAFFFVNHFGSMAQHHFSFFKCFKKVEIFCCDRFTVLAN